MTLPDITIDRSLIQTEEEMLARWGEYDKPLVSINCITYNHEKYIRDALDGFLIQKTDFPFEILVHDDASTDGTADIVREYEKRYPKIIKPIYQVENQYSQGKKPSLFNFERAQGEYIAMCEGDDYWIAPEKVQIQVDFLQKNQEYSICFHSVKINEGGCLKSDYITRDVAEVTNIYELAKGNYIHTPSVVLRKEFLPRKFPNYFLDAPIGDYLIYMMITKNYQKIMKLQKCMAFYRVHDGGVWSKKDTLIPTIEYVELLLPHFNFDKKIFYPLYKTWIKLNIVLAIRNVKLMKFIDIFYIIKKLVFYMPVYYIKMKNKTVSSI